MSPPFVLLCGRVTLSGRFGRCASDLGRLRVSRFQQPSGKQDPQQNAGGNICLYRRDVVSIAWSDRLECGSRSRGLGCAKGAAQRAASSTRSAARIGQGSHLRIWHAGATHSIPKIEVKLPCPKRATSAEPDPQEKSAQGSARSRKSSPTPDAPGPGATLISSLSCDLMESYARFAGGLDLR